MDNGAILKNIEAREAGQSIVGLINDELVRYFDRHDHFFKPIVRAIPREFLPEGPRLAPMTEEEAENFEKEIFPYGRYYGSNVSEVPLDYLFFIDGKRKFQDDLHRYLLSDRVQREQED